MRRLMLFFYGTPNLWGSCFALVGLILFFLNIIHSFWLIIIFGLYAIGFLIAPRNKRETWEMQRKMHIEDVQKELNQLLRRVKRRVPKPIAVKLESIKTSIDTVLPHLMHETAGMNQSVYTIKKTAFEYLPETLENYLALPPAYARTQPIKQGKTAQQILLEQLDILDKEMAEIVVDLNEDNTQKMLAHGRFLEDKFKESDLFL